MTSLIDKVVGGTNNAEATFFYVGGVFYYPLGIKYAEFQQKYSWRFVGKTPKLFIVVTSVFRVVLPHKEAIVQRILHPSVHTYKIRMGKNILPIFRLFRT